MQCSISDACGHGQPIALLTHRRVCKDVSPFACNVTSVKSEVFLKWACLICIPEELCRFLGTAGLTLIYPWHWLMLLKYRVLFMFNGILLFVQVVKTSCCTENLKKGVLC